MLGVLAVLILAAGGALSADAPPKGATGLASAAVVDAAGHTTAIDDAYRRSDVSRRPQPLPATPAVVALLVAIGLGRHFRAAPRAALAPVLAWYSPRGSRGPPARLLV